MMNDIEILLLVTYLQKMYDSNASRDERDYLSIQFANALSSNNERIKGFDIESIVQRYLSLESKNIIEIPTSAHRWLWEFIYHQSDFSLDSTQNVNEIYNVLNDAFVRLYIVRVLLDFSEIELLNEIFKRLIGENNPDGIYGGASNAELEELIDILLDISVGNSNPENILQILLDWINKYLFLDKMFRELLIFRSEYLIGDVGNEIIGALGLE